MINNIIEAIAITSIAISTGLIVGFGIIWVKKLNEMKLIKYKISNKPLKVIQSNVIVIKDEAKHIKCDKHTYTMFPNSKWEHKVFWVQDKSIGVPFNKEQLDKWEEQLKEALESEDYEKAAELRDKIQKKSITL